METTVPQSETKMIGCFWLAADLGEGRLSDRGCVHFSPEHQHETSLAFESLDDLDAVIETLTATRDRLVAEANDELCADDPDGLHHIGCGCETSDVFA